MRRSWALLAALLVVGCAGSAPTVGPATPTPTAGPTCQPGASGPPAVTLTDSSDEEVAGLVGSWDYCAGGSLAPWNSTADLTAVMLPADEVNVVLSSGDGPLFVSWTATYAPASESNPGSPRGLTSASNLHGVDAVSFGGLPSGDWTLSVELLFAGDQGRATYYWHVTAP